MIELECPMCEAALMLAPAEDVVRCRECCITVDLDDRYERMPLALAA